MRKRGLVGGRPLIRKLPEVIAFDLDGTLIDSKPSIVYGIQQLLSALGRPLLRRIG